MITIDFYQLNFVPSLCRKQFSKILINLYLIQVKKTLFTYFRRFRARTALIKAILVNRNSRFYSSFPDCFRLKFPMEIKAAPISNTRGNIVSVETCRGSEV